MPSNDESLLGSLILEAQRRKDLVSFDPKSPIHMVRLAGIEPTTPWFVAKYSIQLSYSRPRQKL